MMIQDIMWTIRCVAMHHQCFKRLTTHLDLRYLMLPRLCSTHRIILRIDPQGQFNSFKSTKQAFKSRVLPNKMNRLTLQLCLLVFFVNLSLSDNITTEKAASPTGPFVCDKNLYDSLSKLKGRVKGPGAQFDLLKTLNETDATDPQKILQRVSQYDFNSVKDYLDMLDQSNTLEQTYVKLSSKDKASFDYQHACSDLCPTYTTFSTPKNLVNTPKPSYLNNFTCSSPDNPFCNDGLNLTEPTDDLLLEDFFKMWIKRDHTGKLLVYKRLQEGGDLEYCYTIDEEKWVIVHMCEKFWQLLIGGYWLSKAFHKQAYETVLTGDPDSQTAINYIITKLKFGERVGAVYNDCRRYGKLPTDIKKPIL